MQVETHNEIKSEVNILSLQESHSSSQNEVKKWTEVTNSVFQI